MLPSEFMKWAANAPAGQRVTYHRGFLMLDCDDTTGNPETIDLFRQLRRIVYSAYQAGTVTLVQRKQPNGSFDYIAVKRRRYRRLD